MQIPSLSLVALPQKDIAAFTTINLGDNFIAD